MESMLQKGTSSTTAELFLEKKGTSFVFAVPICVGVGFLYYRYAVVTGANKGIGLETVRQLASQGITVVLTARDEKRGMEATSKLHHSGLPNVVFHQLDVSDSVSIHNLANFIRDKFGRLDILVRVKF
jgi:NADP-dependent 3-hydroxy acid dehydrogenase YdfG